MQHYDCWLLFVKAAYLLCQRSITLQEVNQADEYLMEFCDTFENLYGKHHLNINLHLHGHLKDCVLDFGPVYAFWLFGFERLNGILESYNTNCRDIPVQLMRHFLSSSEFGIHNWPEEFIPTFSPLLTSHIYTKGSLTLTSLNQSINTAPISPVPPVFESPWESHEKQELQQVISRLSNQSPAQFNILTLFDKVKEITIGKFVLGSVHSRFSSSYMVMATHPSSKESCLSQVHYFARVHANHLSGNVTSSYWIACVCFYYCHEMKLWFGGPNEVWSTATQPDFHFVSLDSIRCHVAFCKREVDFGTTIGRQTVLIVSPLV